MTMKATKVKDINYKRAYLKARGYKRTKTKTYYGDIYSKIEVEEWLENLTTTEGTETKLISFRDNEYHWLEYELWERPKMTREELYIALTDAKQDLIQLAYHYEVDYKKAVQIAEDIERGLY